MKYTAKGRAPSALETARRVGFSEKGAPKAVAFAEKTIRWALLPKRKVRPLLCAHCGKAISGKGGFLKMSHTKLPGRPRAGWHEDCLMLDDLAVKLVANHWEKLDEAFATIEARDPARVLRRSR